MAMVSHIVQLRSTAHKERHLKMLGFFCEREFPMGGQLEGQTDYETKQGLSLDFWAI